MESSAVVPTGDRWRDAFVTQERDGSWTWRIVDGDGATVVEAGEKYPTAAACGVALRRFPLIAELDPSFR